MYPQFASTFATGRQGKEPGDGGAAGAVRTQIPEIKHYHVLVRQGRGAPDLFPALQSCGQNDETWKEGK